MEAVDATDPQQDHPRDASTHRPDYGGLAQSVSSLLADIAARMAMPSNLCDTEATAARFDVSPFRLWLLFQSVDDNQSGFITKKELCDALMSASLMKMNRNSKAKLTKLSMVRTDKTAEELMAQHTDEDHGEQEPEDFIPLQDIQALNELFDRVVSQDSQRATERASSSDYDNSGKKNDEEESGDGDKTEQHDNCNTEDSVGISFPQFCRMVRFLWLQQLLHPGLDSGADPQNEFTFDCLDYSTGYFRHEQISSNVSNKRARDFFTAPRHGLARVRWIDVPSGTFSPEAVLQRPYSIRNRNNQKDSFCLTMLRLAVKYRFHPTSIEGAIHLEYQKPKVNSFEHSLLDLGMYNCGTLSWLRNAGDHECTPTYQQLGNWSLDADITATAGIQDSVPRPRPASRTSSAQSFRSYHQGSAQQGGGSNNPNSKDVDDINVNEGRHYFITIPMFELSRRSQTSLELYTDVSPRLSVTEVEPIIIEVNVATLGMFVASLPDANLVVTCSTKWRQTRIRPFRFKDYNRSRARRFFHRRATTRKTPTNMTNVTGSTENELKKRLHRFGSLDDDATGSSKKNINSAIDSSDIDSSDDDSDEEITNVVLQDEKPPLERVKKLLKKRHNIQRHRNSSWLMHAIIDAVVDHLDPIPQIYEAQLQRLSNRLFEHQHRLSKRDIKVIVLMKRDLEWLHRQLRPFARVIRHLIDDNYIGTEVTHYLEDVEDHLNAIMEELSSLASECTSLRDEYDAYVDRRMNDILFVLTLVTTLVVPGKVIRRRINGNINRPPACLHK
jgi:CorA-like Mg2+ transporter protein